MRRRTAHALAVRVAAGCLWASVATGQVQTGHYIPGWNAGLTVGMMAEEPGVYGASNTFYIHAEEFKDGAGNTVPGPGNLNYGLTELALVWRPDFRLFEADYQVVVAPSFGNIASLPSIVAGEAPSDASFGLSDTFIAPLMLGWHWDEFHLVGALGTFAPTGSFDLGDASNTGTGFWTVMPYVTATWRSERVFEGLPVLAMGALRYEVHSEQDGHDFRPGDTLTFEWGLGAELGATTSLGVGGFLYRQVTDPTGADVLPVDRYASNGIGLLFSQGIGPVDAGLRVYRDFDVKNGPVGTFFYFDISWSF